MLYLQSVFQKVDELENVDNRTSLEALPMDICVSSSTDKEAETAVEVRN